MKMKIKRISKSALSVILALMMLLSTMLIGTMSVNAATITKWTIASYTINGNWDKGESKTTIDGSYGSITVDTQQDLKNKDSNHIWFKVYAYQDNWIPNKTPDSVVTANKRNTLSWNSEVQLQFDYSKRYVTFKFETDGTNNYLTVTESDTGSVSEDVTASDWKLNSDIYESNWSEVEFTSASGSVVYLDVTPKSTGTYYFGIKNKSGNHYYKNGTKITSTNTSTTLTTGGNSDAQIEMSVSGTYKFAFDTSNGYLTVTYPNVQSDYTLAFGSNNGTYGSVTATDESGNPVYAGPIASGTKVTFTATPNSNYKVDGWYSDRTFSNKISGTSTETTYTTTITANTDVYVQFVEDTVSGENTVIYVDKNTYNALYVWAEASGTKVEPLGNWDSGNSITSRPTDTIDGVEYYVVTIPNSDFESFTTFNMIGRKSNSQDEAKNNLTVGSTYILKANNDLVAQADPSKIKPTFKDGKTSDSKTVKSNTQLDLNVEAELKGITDSAQYLEYSSSVTPYTGVTLSGSDTANPKFIATSEGTYTVTTTVTNKENPSLTAIRTTTVKVSDTEPSVVYKVKLYDGSTIEMEETYEGSGVYISTENVISNADDNYTGNAIFTIQKTEDGVTTYAKSNGANNFWLKKENKMGSVVEWVTDVTSIMSSEKKNAYRNASGTAYQIKFNPNKGPNGTVSLPLPASINAKNGTYDSSTSQYRTANYGTTVVDGVGIVTKVTDAGIDEKYYKKYAINATGTVTVTTTINEAYADDYYIPAFVVNGRSYEARTGTGSSYYFYLPVDTQSDEDIEITPVYYLNACKTEGQYIKFYVDANNLTGTFDWGNTISCYSYYYKNGKDNTDGSFEADGGYPGQPMLFDTDYNMYYALLPKTMNEKGISGITINNYSLDPVHRSIAGDSINRQSYDFNDMKYLSELGNDIIRLDMMPRSATYTNSSIKDSNDISGIINEFNGTTRNAFDEFTDISGDYIDIYGEKVDKNAPVGLYIVSHGAYGVSGMGSYMTKWRVYGADKKFIVEGTPSEFIPRVKKNADGKVEVDAKGKPVIDDIQNQTAALQALYSNGNKTYAGKMVKISYENGRDLASAMRYDGRWYYRNSADTYTNVTVKYQLSDDNGATWTDAQADVNRAYIDYNGERSTELSVPTNTQVEVSALTPPGYIFDCFGTVDKDGNNFVELADAGSTLSPVLSLDVNYVARFVKAEEGALTISHEKYRGAGAKGGSGLYKLEVNILKPNGDIFASYIGSGTGANGQSISIALNNIWAEEAYDYSLQIKLITTTSGQNEFRSWYETTEEGVAPIGDKYGNMTCNGAPITDPANQKGTLTYTFEKKLSFYYNEDRKLICSSLNYYSDINPVTRDYTITYIYNDRFGAEKSFVYKNTHEDTYYDDHYGSWVPDGELIKQHAPYIDDLYKDCKWNVEDVSVDGTSVTVRAEQPDKTYKVKIIDETDASEQFDLKLNSLVYKANTEEFFEVPSKNSDDQIFQYWEVYNTELKSVVAKCFSTKFNLRVTCDCEIRPVYSTETTDVAFISDAQYTREQYTQNGVDYDYIHVDFIVSYMEKNGILLNSAKGYKSGLIVEYDTDPANMLKENKENDTLSETEKKQLSGELTDEQIKTYLDNKNSKDGLDLAESRKLVNFSINNSKYNNKNRLDYYIKFNNKNEKMRRYVYRAYYYVMDAQGNVTVSKPVYFYLYDIGNKKEAAFVDPTVTN